LYGAPEDAHALLDKLAQTCAVFLEAQVKAGADVVQIFGSWDGIVSPGDFREYPLRYAKAVIAHLRTTCPGTPIIYFVNGCAPYLDDYASSGADVLGVDWRVGIDEVRRRVGDGVALQGNLDPGALFAPPSEIRARVADILARAGAVGHIFNLGHGVLPETDPEHVRAMVTAVRELSART
jgi:uroporphyrinogen decarboxylase